MSSSQGSSGSPKVSNAAVMPTLYPMASDLDRPPYEAYAAIMGVFAGLLGGAAIASRAFGRDPQRQTALDFAVLAAASFKAARTLSKDEVTSFLREPFVRGEAHS